MLTASVENMLVASIDTTLETGVVPTQYIVIISTVRQQSDSDSRKLVSNVGSTLVRLLISAWVEHVMKNTICDILGCRLDKICSNTDTI